jgi:hypothetical protein
MAQKYVSNIYFLEKMQFLLICGRNITKRCQHNFVPYRWIIGHAGHNQCCKNDFMFLFVW